MRTLLTQPWARWVVTAVLAVAATTSVSACSSSPPAASGNTAADTASTPTTGRHLAAADFATAIKAPGTIVLDVRSPAEFAGGHLPAARNIDIQGSDFATQIAALDKGATYAVYCHSGKRSAAALEQMAAAELRHTYDLAGGITAWQNMGGLISNG